MTGPDRDTALSLFPELRPDRPIGPLVGSVIGGTNADLIAQIAPIYLTRNSVLDATWGRGGWWRRWRPDHLTAHDIALDGVDFRALPEPDHSVDVVCFDPPYVPCGSLPQIVETSHRHTAGDFRQRFGLQPMSPSDITDLFHDGMTEAARVARRWVIAKCADYVSGGIFRLGHLDMIAAAQMAGLSPPHDLIIHHTGNGPGGHNITTQLRARRHHSYLLVFTASQENTNG